MADFEELVFVSESSALLKVKGRCIFMIRNFLVWSINALS
jgi:hypothetical protein